MGKKNCWISSIFRKNKAKWKKKIMAHKFDKSDKISLHLNFSVNPLITIKNDNEKSFEKFRASSAWKWIYHSIYTWSTWAMWSPTFTVPERPNKVKRHLFRLDTKLTQYDWCDVIKPKFREFFQKVFVWKIWKNCLKFPIIPVISRTSP